MPSSLAAAGARAGAAGAEAIGGIAEAVGCVVWVPPLLQAAATSAVPVRAEKIAMRRPRRGRPLTGSGAGVARGVAPRA
ncbi:MAG TPA: hypothetical protein VLK79_15630 [Gaiellales bacterium]|nr:hypothetical protein [Gaiellales bacterium]